MISLSIVIPVFNEELSIKEVVQEHIKEIQENNQSISDWEIILLDDASYDNTWQELLQLKANHSRIRLLQNEINQGITSSFLRLFLEADKDYIYVTAGDGQWPAINLSKLIKELEETQADIIVGVRENRRKVYHLDRRILSYGFNQIARVFFNVNSQDLNGIKLGRKEIFTLPIASKSFFSEIERFMLVQKRGYSTAFTSVVFVSRKHGSEKGNKPMNIINTALDMIKYFIKSPNKT